MEYRVFTLDTNGYLIVHGVRSLLIDCPAVDMAARVRAVGLPRPDAILHTQVQEEHCREWASLAGVPVYVHPDSMEVAKRSEAFFRDCRTTWPTDRPWVKEYRGAEKHGIAGCITERPPERPLNVAGTLRPGLVFHWEGLDLEILELTGCGRHALGFHWPAEGILFSGDLLRAGGYLVNLYDCERSYGGLQGYWDLEISLRRAAAFAPKVMLPSTGPSVKDPAGDIQKLARSLQRVMKPSVRGGNLPPPRQPMREFGLFRQHEVGLYQNRNFGNMILYVDDNGRGLCVDPDPCVWSDWETNCRLVHAELDRLENEAGLKQIEWALATHYHGDHFGFIGLLRERYGTKFLATPDVAAIIERPQAYNYPSAVDWYGLPFDHVDVDRRIAYDETIRWHETEVTPIWTPGHCSAHAGFVIPWRGLKTVCTGDTLQYGGGPFRPELPVTYSDTALPERGLLVTIEKLLAIEADLILGGHSAYVTEPTPVLQEWHEAAREIQSLAAALAPEGEITRAMTPPGWDDKRPAQQEGTETSRVGWRKEIRTSSGRRQKRHRKGT